MNILLSTLIKEGLVSEAQLEEARIKQIGAKKPLQQLLVEMGFISAADLMRISSKIFKIPVTSLDEAEIDPEVIKMISYETAKRCGIFPLRKQNDVLIIAMSDPDDVVTIDDIRRMTGLDIEPILSTENDISKYIEKYYQSDDTVYDVLKNVPCESTVTVVKKKKGPSKMVSPKAIADEQAPAVKLVNLIITDAIEVRASDIHIEPYEDIVRVRYRVDGDLRNIMEISKKVHLSIVTRLKVMAQMDIAETRKSQDGRMSISLSGRNIDLRVSSIPMHYGEKVVLRVLDPQQAKVNLEILGFLKDELRIFKEACAKSQGMILVTGPTGSGKTSTLYGALYFVKSETKNIITIEDPIEYLMEGINQIQVNPVKDVTFANGLRNILRQDPDIILVGEIRDNETAEIAFKASSTGHLVFSTLHTNSSVASISRLLDMELEPYTIASSLVLVVAQRLVKKICFHCKEEYAPGDELLHKFKRYIEKYKLVTFFRGKGCQSCNFSGYSGRSAIFEILRISDTLKRCITESAPEGKLLEAARASGFTVLAESGIQKVAEGITTLEEIARVCDVAGEQEVLEPTTKESQTKKILVVDDEKHIRMMVSSRLANEGFKVFEASNGQEAIEFAVKEQPDLIVMDVMMPVMDGFEATKVLRSKLQTAVIPILMLTAKKDVESEIEGIDAGADDYMGKPFDGNRLLARIKMLLRRR